MRQRGTNQDPGTQNDGDVDVEDGKDEGDGGLSFGINLVASHIQSLQQSGNC